MIVSLVQFEDARGRGVAALDAAGAARRIAGFASTLALAEAAIARQCGLAELAAQQLQGALDLSAVRLCLPLDHPDPARILVSGTGLTHLGSAEGRARMHAAAQAQAAQTDSMRMFLKGIDGGKPAPGAIGVQPEWFYKGDGSILVASGEPLVMPGFAGDGGDEAEIAGLYLVDAEGVPRRLGFALGNEFSDHLVERENYLWLAPSKLRQAALAPELRLGALPADLRGISRIRRDGAVLWERPFLSGEANMCHSLANLEHHHFKNAAFRRPGSLHIHFFGTATLSFSDDIRTRPGDVFEICADGFHLPVTNPLARVDDAALVQAVPL
ncbi:MAG: FAH family protein [Sphingomonadales bacterium]|nr:FAH family protein [Sphingomonadales bacterium]